MLRIHLFQSLGQNYRYSNDIYINAIILGFYPKEDVKNGHNKEVSEEGNVEKQQILPPIFNFFKI